MYLFSERFRDIFDITIQILIFFSAEWKDLHTPKSHKNSNFHSITTKAIPKAPIFRLLWSQKELFHDEYIIIWQCHSFENVPPILRFRKSCNQRDRILDWRGGQNCRSHFRSPFEPVCLLRFEAAEDEERLQQMLNGIGMHRHHFSVNFDHWSIQEKVISRFFSFQFEIFSKFVHFSKKWQTIIGWLTSNEIATIS